MRKETDVQRAILQYLQMCHKELTVWRNNNITWQKKGKWVNLASTVKGIPDILGYTDKGIFVAVEVKRSEKAPRSEHQENFIKSVQDAGGIAFFTWSVDDCEEKLKKYLTNASK